MDFLQLFSRNVHAGLGYQDPRKKYEAVFSFSWEPSQEYCRILYLGNLLELEVTAVADPWNPTKHILSLIKVCSQGFRGSGSSSSSYDSRPKVLNNHLAVHDFLSVEELTDSRSMITLYKDDNECSRSLKTERNSVSPSLSVLALDSASITTTDDSEDED